MESSATPHATPAQLKILELHHDEVVLKAARIQGLFHFLNFTDAAAFDKCLGRSGKSPDCLSRGPDGRPAPRKYANITTTSQDRRIRQQAATRSIKIVAQRKEPAALTAEETLARLKNVFLAYTDPMLYAHTGRREMNIVGFLRLMRDCRLLDNRLTLVAADVIFTRVDAGTDAEGGPTGTEPGDMHVDFDEFMRCLRAVVRIKFPRATDPHEAMLLLARQWVLPFARDSGAGGGVGNTVDGLFSRSTMNLVRKYDNQLKKLFAWYCNMDETDPARITWSWAREHAGAINSSQFVLMLLNFSVLPVLLSKHTALEVFIRCEAANDGDERANAMFYPAFLETLAEVALEVGKYAVARIRAATSPDELKLLRRYAECCPPPHGTAVMQAYKEALINRGRDASSLDQHALYDTEGIKRRNEEQVAAAAQKQAETHAKDVMQRREGLRQRFALTRLRNFYRDVRTFNNNNTWPPERDVSPATHRNGPGPAGSGGASDGEGVHVAFYDSERAIKTPRPVWIPVGPSAGRRHGQIPPAADAPSPSGASLPDGGNFLLVDSPSGAVAASRQTAFASASGGGVGGGVPRGAFAAGGFQPPSPGAYVRSPKPPYQLKVSIEDRDEHEAILDLANRLPYIVVPTAAAPEGLHPEGSSWSAPCHGTKQRAVTAPAELNRRRPSGDGCAAAGAGDAARPAGGRPAAASGTGAEHGPVEQDCGAERSGPLRPRLPPVHHQLHRTQATAAALAVLAGCPPPNPYQQTSTLHLPPALGASQLHSLPSAASSLARHAQGTGSLGPSPSQLSMGLYSPNTSQRFSPHTPLSRRRHSQRKRCDVGGLPNLQLPDDTGPSSEVVAALDELDRFDDARVVAARGRSISPSPSRSPSPSHSPALGGGRGQHPPWPQEAALYA